MPQHQPWQMASIPQHQGKGKWHPVLNTSSGKWAGGLASGSGQMSQDTCHVSCLLELSGLPFLPVLSPATGLWPELSQVAPSPGNRHCWGKGEERATSSKMMNNFSKPLPICLLPLACGQSCRGRPGFQQAADTAPGGFRVQDWHMAAHTTTLQLTWSGAAQKTLSAHGDEVVGVDALEELCGGIYPALQAAA